MRTEVNLNSRRGRDQDSEIARKTNGKKFIGIN